MPHEPVLLREAVDALVRNPDGSYVDCTYGRGGHSRAILRRLSPLGRLLVMDRDRAAVEDARQSFAGDDRVRIEHGCFSELAAVTGRLGLEPFQGVLLDLGVSSPQLDDPGRGFSFLRDGPLDMRMDQESGPTAGEWLNRAPADEIERVLRDYGEERFARRIARRIVEGRQETPLLSTAQLAALVDAAVPARERHKHPATRSFQGIRIYLNQELDRLHALLESVIPLLAVSGRIVVISFHSLEDRIVKNFIRRHERGEPLPRRLPVRALDVVSTLRGVGKPVRPDAEEVRRNPRARSAVMRVAERCA